MPQICRTIAHCAHRHRSCCAGQVGTFADTCLKRWRSSVGALGRPVRVGAGPSSWALNAAASGVLGVGAADRPRGRDRWRGSVSQTRRFERRWEVHARLGVQGGEEKAIVRQPLGVTRLAFSYARERWRLGQSAASAVDARVPRVPMRWRNPPSTAVPVRLQVIRMVEAH